MFLWMISSFLIILVMLFEMLLKYRENDKCFIKYK